MTARCRHSAIQPHIACSLKPDDPPLRLASCVGRAATMEKQETLEYFGMLLKHGKFTIFV
jgi:hypothetical protein